MLKEAPNSESIAPPFPVWETLPLNVLSAHDETKEMRDNWVVWFGIPGQWLPQWEPVPDQAASAVESRVLREFET